MTGALGLGAISGEFSKVPGAAVRLTRINARLLLRPSLWLQAASIFGRFNLLSPSAVANAVRDRAAFRVKVRKAISELSVLVGLPAWAAEDVEEPEADADVETRDLSGNKYDDCTSCIF